MQDIRRRIVLAGAAVLLGVLPTARAQVPAHKPGTICQTARFWCWAGKPGPVGAACQCPSPDGWVPGTLG